MRFLVTAIIVCLSFAIYAQSTDRVMKTMPTPYGKLFFIKPIELSVKKPKGCSFEADYTYPKIDSLEGNDTVSINYTITYSKPVKEITSIQVSSASGNFTELISTTQLYLERDKKKWVSRFSSTIPIDTFLAFLQDPKHSIKLNTNIGEIIVKSTSVSKKNFAVAFEVLSIEN